ncbi:MAG: TMEM175 family protein [Acidobacteriota bacterium]|nr:TMEM175 family protein [Acidobacteriota bacterium]
MEKNRLEAFSDGVIAIIITIMVLELKVPHESDLHALVPLAPTFLAYVLSFAFVGIFWNNHHHMLNATQRIDGRVLWANLTLLFFLSLFPFATAWMGEHHAAAAPSALYGTVLLASAISYIVLQQTIIAAQGPHSLLQRAVGNDGKGKLSMVLIACGIVSAFCVQYLAQCIYAAVACIWLVPDRRIERVLSKSDARDDVRRD